LNLTRSGDGFLETLAGHAERRMDGVCLTAWTTIRPPVYSATERIKEGVAFRDSKHLCQTEAQDKCRWLKSVAVPQQHQTSEKPGDPGGTRTPDQQLRRLLLYPAELRDRCAWLGSFSAFLTKMNALLGRSCGANVLNPTMRHSS